MVFEYEYACLTDHHNRARARNLRMHTKMSTIMGMAVVGAQCGHGTQTREMHTHTKHENEQDLILKHGHTILACALRM
jgi:hypothetical protein